MVLESSASGFSSVHRLEKSLEEKEALMALRAEASAPLDGGTQIFPPKQIERGPEKMAPQ
jgi:hypothetical protein